MTIYTITSAVITVAVLLVVVSSTFHRAHAFVSNYQSPTTPARRTMPSTLWYADSPDALTEMNASEIRNELESYGISTASMFERREFEEALNEARLSEKDGTRKDPKTTTTSDNDKEANETVAKKSQNEDSRNTVRDKWSTKWENMASAAKENLEKFATGSSSSDPSSAEKKHRSTNPKSYSAPSSSSSSSSSPLPKTFRTRKEQYEIALEEGRSMKLSNLKKELQDRGISTGSFFEKSDLVKAYANAIADDVKAKWSRGYNSSGRKKQNFDPSYRDVIMQAFDPSTLLMTEGMVIDIMANAD